MSRTRSFAPGLAGRSTRRVLQLGALTFAALATSGATEAPPAARAAGPARCDVPSMQAAAPGDTTIVSAEWTAAPVRHCRVDGYVTTTNPGPNRNNFRLQLPEPARWNKRYYFIGLGGSGGYVPTDSQIPRGNPVAKGFAVAGTDKGHQGPALDWSFTKDPAKALDNAHRGAHVTTVAAQQLTRTFYGVERMFRYHSGCSGGGEMGIQAIQKHPQDYDGVLLGWPGGRHPDPAKANIVRNYATILRAVTREPGAWVSPQKRLLAERRALEACDMLDGARDEMIWDHRKCRFDFTTMVCKPGETKDCLTRPEAVTLNTIVRETPAPISNMSMWGPYIGNAPLPWSPSPAPENAQKAGMAYVILNGWARTHLRQPERDVIKQPVSVEEAELILADRAKVSGTEPGGTADIDAFARAGGKAIFFVGVSDPCCSNIANEQYMVDLAKRMSWARLNQSAALYQVPGWGHCGGGTGPTDGADRMLEALIDWVEKGQTPRGVVMHRGQERAKLMFADAPGASESGVAIPESAGRPRDFLVCPFPMESRFMPNKAKGPDAVYDAENWVCRPAAPPKDKART